VSSGSRRGDATLPPPGLPGLDRRWSRLVTAADADGVRRTWHVLDNGVEPSAGTVVCVHGNPTWSYLWRRVLAKAPPGWRVVALDHLGMGYSERPAGPRTLEQRIDDLTTVLETLAVTGPVVIVAHDWGGPISLGWALAHPGRVRGLVLANTAVEQPEGRDAPVLIRLARSRLLRRAACSATPLFVRVTGLLSRPALPHGVRAALAAPYATADRRRAVEEFVADIPLEPDHVSAACLRKIADGLPDLAGVPVLLQWGPRDPVFSERYLRDLNAGLPHADVHRYAQASHLVTEDAPQAADDAWRWILADRDAVPPRRGDDVDPARTPVWTGLAGRAGDAGAAIVEVGRPPRMVSFDLLERRVRELAAGLAAVGVRPGERVALLIPPGADLTAAVYACWRAGAVVVVADAGLGASGLARALRSAHPDHVIAVPRGLMLAAALRVPGHRVAAGPVSRAAARLLGAPHRMIDLARLGADRDDFRQAVRDAPPVPSADAEAAVLFTSGATGPPKGVVYRHKQLQAQLETLRALYRISEDDALVAAFPPFVLYGPALGIPSAVPSTRTPGALTAAGLADAVAAVDATVVFASVAVLRTLVATAAALDPQHRAALARVRLLVSAGAPVPVALLRAVREVLPHADAHTPYGMTEALPVTDVSAAELDDAGEGNGVCVGRPVPGVHVRISPFTIDALAVDALAVDALAVDPLTDEPGRTGEVWVRAAHVKDRYDQLWAVEHRSAGNPGWHRSGDVGHLDDRGRLWVEGRLAHVVSTSDGPVTPVGIEQRVEVLDGVRTAAVVGVGPPGAQQVVLVIVPNEGVARPGARVLAPEPLTAEVRRAAAVPVAAVLVTSRLPVDVRHASKIDRTRVARWAGRMLAGDRAGRTP
jgi:acyl-coenzyme A synthetase/AMP-(fatty) acid ligase/pimeloyl-ACP methyl ester carboxylesterase